MLVVTDYHQFLRHDAALRGPRCGVISWRPGRGPMTSAGAAGVQTVSVSLAKRSTPGAIATEGLSSKPPADNNDEKGSGKR